MISVLLVVVLETCQFISFLFEFSEISSIDSFSIAISGIVLNLLLLYLDSVKYSQLTSFLFGYSDVFLIYFFSIFASGATLRLPLPTGALFWTQLKTYLITLFEFFEIFLIYFFSTCSFLHFLNWFCLCLDFVSNILNFFLFYLVSVETFLIGFFSILI